MNRHERRAGAKGPLRASPASRKTTISVKTSDLADMPSGCVWNGCRANFTGDMPEGWAYLIAYHDKRPTIADWSRKDWLERPYSDLCLCPEHCREFSGLLKLPLDLKGNTIELMGTPQAAFSLKREEPAMNDKPDMMYELTITFTTEPGNIPQQSEKARYIAEGFGFEFEGGEGKDLRFRRDSLPLKEIMPDFCSLLRKVVLISTWGIKEIET